MRINKTVQKKRMPVFLSIIYIFIMIVSGCQNIREQGEVNISSEEPVCIVAGKPLGEESGEPYQFPSAGRTIDGDIYVICSGIGHQDTTQGYENEGLCFISKDQGETWNGISITSLIKADIRLPNGAYFQGAKPQNSYEADLSAFTPLYVEDGLSIYYASDISEFKKTITFQEYNPSSETISEFESTIDWKYMPVAVNNEEVMPLNAIAYLSQFYQYEDTLYMVMYCKGFDNEGGGVNGQYNIYIFQSTDSARSWSYTGQLISAEIPEIKNSIGWQEPFMLFDGQKFRILLRTGSGTPIYMASAKEPSVWTKPVEFRNFGVKPQMCLLENGILVASYGRPGIEVIASRDKYRAEWCDPYILDNRPKSADDSWNYSCCYTSMVPISENEFLIFYCDFKYEVDGKEVKAVLCRKLRVQ